MRADKVKELFIELYDIEADAVFRFCLLRTSDRETAMDITQDTFMRLWDVLSRQTEVKNARAYLFTVARNLVIDWYRKKKSLSLEAMAEDENVDPEALLAHSGKEAVEMETEARYLIEKMNELPADYREAVYLRFVEDLKPAEISEILGEPVNTVSVRINRGIKRLREIAGE